MLQRMAKKWQAEVQTLVQRGDDTEYEEALFDLLTSMARLLGHGRDATRACG